MPMLYASIVPAVYLAPCIGKQEPSKIRLLNGAG